MFVILAQVSIWNVTKLEHKCLSGMWQIWQMQQDKKNTKSASVLGVHRRDWCWSWNSNTLATWCEELTHLKRLWCRERLMAGGEGDDRGWDGWMASPTQWTWVWVDSGSWWWTERPGVHGVAKSQTWLNIWTELKKWNSHSQTLRLYTENPKASTEKPFKLVSEFCKVPGYKVNF